MKATQEILEALEYHYQIQVDESARETCAKQIEQCKVELRYSDEPASRAMMSATILAAFIHRQGLADVGPETVKGVVDCVELIEAELAYRHGQK